MKKKEILIGLAILVIISAGLIYYYKNVYSSAGKGSLALDAKIKNDNTGNNVNDCFKGEVTVNRSWELPKELLEISGIAWIDKDRVATVQDNEGTIFIYNFNDKKIERQIKFGQPGDYEGIEYVAPNYFVIRSDGFIYEVNTDGKILNEYDLPLTVEDNTESTHYDVANNRLLIGQKKSGKSSNEIYSFDLSSRQFNPKPVYTIDLVHDVFACGAEGKAGKKKSNSTGLRPSSMAIDPKTKDFYIADGPKQRILVLSPDAQPKHFLQLDKKLFPQAEGLMFSPEGKLYVSTEGQKGPASIATVDIKMY